MEENKTNLKIKEIKKKQLLSMSVAIKEAETDGEQILYDHLYPKYGNRFLNYRSKYENYLKDKNHNLLPDYPISVILELVNRCNLECTMCFQGYRNNAKKSTLQLQDLKKLFDDFKTNKLEALLFSASEPLLYKDFDKVLQMAEEAEIMDQFLFTNGTLLNKKNSEIILKSSLTRLFISIDAATESTYDKVRIPVDKKKLNSGRLAIIEKNVKDFVKLRNLLGKKLPLVRVSFVALDTNVHESNQFIKKWKSIVDSVEIQKENSINFYEDIKKQNISKNRLLKKYNCNEPWGQITINSDGTVGPCCNTVGRNLPIGNIFENDLKEIWHNKKISEIRNSFVRNDPCEICQLCLENEKLNI